MIARGLRPAGTAILRIMSFGTRLGATLVALILPSADAAPATPADPLANPVGSRTRHRVVELAGGLAHPWSIAFLPDGAALITERIGGLRLFRDGAVLAMPLPGLPAAHQKGDGGLLGLAVDPRFTANRRIFLCLSTGTSDANAATVIRFRLAESRVEDVSEVFRAQPLKKGDGHYGCRLQFLPDGTLLATLGDGYDYSREAQSPGNHLGKVVRINADGTVPRGNPFAGRSDARPEVYTLGHRNVQGVALRPGSAEIWVHEHGARGGDELNVLRPGANYGWPVVTYGIDYSGASISAATAAPGLTPPRFYWVPSIAPSGMAFYDGDRFPEWRGDLFVGALAARALYRLDFERGQIVGQEILLAERKQRIRDVRAGPDGLLYVLTDAADGKLLRIEPAT
jgi:aldose sugar dehydrogenase